MPTPTGTTPEPTLPSVPTSPRGLTAQNDGDHGDAGPPADLGQGGAGVVEGEPTGDQRRRVQPPGGDQAEQLRVGVRGHPVAAEHLQLQADRPAPSGPRAGPAPAAAAPPGRAARAGGGSGSSSSQVIAAPSASSETCAPPPVSSSTAAGTSRRRPRACSAPSARARSRARRRDVDGDHPGAGRRRDLDRGEPHAAAPVHRDPFAGPHPARPARRPGRRSRTGSPARRPWPGPARRGRRTRLTSAASRATNSASDPQCVKPGWVWRAHTCCSPAAHWAQVPAGVDERHGHPVTRPTVRVVPRRPRPPSPASSWPGTCGSDDVRVVAPPGVPVAAADPAGRHPDDDAARRRLRIADLPHLERTTEGVEDQRAHGRQPALTRSLSSGGCPP